MIYKKTTYLTILTGLLLVIFGTSISAQTATSPEIAQLKQNCETCQNGLTLLKENMYKYPNKPYESVQGKKPWNEVWAAFTGQHLAACNAIGSFINSNKDNDLVKQVETSYKNFNVARWEDYFNGRLGILSHGSRIPQYCPGSHRIQYDCVAASQRMMNYSIPGVEKVISLLNTLEVAGTEIDITGLPAMELLPTGQSGERRGDEVPTDKDLTIKFLFVYFDNDNSKGIAPKTDTEYIWKKLIGYLSKDKSLLEQGLKRQGFSKEIKIDAASSWQEMGTKVSSYEDNERFNYKKYVKDAHNIMGGPFNESTILVIVPDTGDIKLQELFDKHNIREVAHSTPHIYDDAPPDNIKIKSTIAVNTKACEQEDYRLLMHEMGHSFGSPDLYPKSGTKHEVGAFGIMADSRSATSYIGWNRFRYGWIPPSKTKQLTKKGSYTVNLKKPTLSSESSGITTIAFPDPKKYNKMWVVELTDTIRSGKILPTHRGELISKESDRIIVYTVEEPAFSDKRSIRVIEEIALTQTKYIPNIDWVKAKSYGLNESFTNKDEDAPFSFSVTDSLSGQFQLSVNIHEDLELRNFPKKLKAGDYKTLITEDLDFKIDNFKSNKQTWSLKSLFEESLRNDHYAVLRNGELQLIDKEDMGKVKKRIPIYPPTAGVKYKLTEEGKLQVVDKKNGEVYWENIPADQTVGNFKLEFEPNGLNIVLKGDCDTGCIHKWDLRALFKEKSLDNYLRLKDGQIQQVRKKDQKIIQAIQTDAPPGAKIKYNLNSEGKIQVVDKENGKVYWQNFPDDQTVGKFKLEFRPDGRNIVLTKDSKYEWDALYRIPEFKKFIGSKIKRYFRIKNNHLQFIDPQNVDTPSAQKELGDGAVALKLDSQTGEIHAVDKDGKVVSVLYTR